MFKCFINRNSFMYLGLFFLIYVLFMGYLLFDKSAPNDIVANGIETTGYIVEGSATSTIKENKEEYYSIKYYFMDEDSYKHTGTTSESFTLSEIINLEEHGSIIIKYNPETFDSIEANYNPPKDVEYYVFLFFLIAFSIGDTILWVCFVVKGIRNLNHANAATKGKEYTATVTGISSNESYKYQVNYSWVDDSGKTQNASSPLKYNYNEATAFESTKTITIKVLGKASVITTVLDVNLAKQYSKMNDSHSNLSKKIKSLKCDYCGHPISEKDERCRKCNSKINIHK